MRQRAAWLYEQLDQVRKLRKQAKAGMLAESRHHRAITLLRSIPQLGPIRSAQIVATADTPHRFRTKRQFWSYSGLAVVTHTSAEEGGARIALGQTAEGRYLRVVYVPDPIPNSVFVITAYELGPKARRALRRRRKRAQ